MKNNTVKLIPTRPYHASPRLTDRFKRKLKSEVRLCFVNRDFIELIQATLAKLPARDKFICLHYFLKLAKQELRQADPEWVYVTQEQYNNYMDVIHDEQEQFEPVRWITAELEYLTAIQPQPTEMPSANDTGASAPVIADNELLPEKRLMEMLSVSKSKLDRLRSEGLPFTKIGKPIYYDLNAVKSWLKANAA